MAAAGVRLTGYDDLLADLRHMTPRELSNGAAPLVDDAVEVTAAQLIQSYPLGDTGNLRKGVRKKVKQTATGIIGTVNSTAPHAHLWEFGTVVRKTAQGWNRGEMKKQYDKGLVGIASRNRRRMDERLIAFLRQVGFQVTGDV